MKNVQELTSCKGRSERFLIHFHSNLDVNWILNGDLWLNFWRTWFYFHCQILVISRSIYNNDRNSTKSNIWSLKLQKSKITNWSNFRQSVELRMNFWQCRWSEYAEKFAGCFIYVKWRAVRTLSWAERNVCDNSDTVVTQVDITRIHD